MHGVNGELKEKNIQYQSKISYIEIYNEQIFDLLSAKRNESLDIREHPINGIVIPKLTEQVIANEEEAQHWFAYGQKDRKVAETCNNEQSSRSHTIFRMHLEIRDFKNMNKILFSELNLIDLAGSENISKNGKQESRQKESVNINKSLLALSTVIQKLSNNQGCFINFRDSKLTRLLQNSLSGNCQTAVICTINPANYYESINTLKFGITAGAVKIKVQINEKSIFEENLGIQKEEWSQILQENNKLKV